MIILQSHREKHPIFQKQKVFVECKSLIDELLEVQHFRTIYNIFVAMLCIFILRAVIVDFLDNGCFVLDLEIFTFSFGGLHMVPLPWLIMFLYTLLMPYKVLQIWAASVKTLQFPTLLTVIAAVVLLIGHTTVLGFYPIYTVVSQPFGPASRLIIILEQLRFLMKSHSFLRETVPPILRATSNNGKMQPPQFSTYLYFLFCPTFIYREHYPRTPDVRWGYVIGNFTKFFGCLISIAMLYKCHFIPIFSNANKHPFSFKTLVLYIFNAIVPAIYCLLLSFFGFLHCWQNAFAEMLRFADRSFYKDWWNATSFPVYFRNWNLIVHDWLYYYVYQDLMWVLKGKAQSVALLSTFITSAVAHEYAITLSFGFFYPFQFILWILIVLGGIIHSTPNRGNKSPNKNIQFWACFLVGVALQFSLPSLEWYAQVHCPVQKNTSWTRMIPRFWSCYS
ncbi:sterol O-acyltransferase 2-like [Anolis sagrei]|uniref:sterol O-acyltransferase 2-like n=1 Tax=Anolis sagrei TaxID=38937 RepID=UPI0035202D53